MDFKTEFKMLFIQRIAKNMKITSSPSATHLGIFFGMMLLVQDQLALFHRADFLM